MHYCKKCGSEVDDGSHCSFCLRKPKKDICISQFEKDRLEAARMRLDIKYRYETIFKEIEHSIEV